MDLVALVTDECPSKCPRIQPEEMNTTFLQCNLGLRPQIWEFPVNLQDDIQRAYIRAKPCQPKLLEYPFSGTVIIVADFKPLGLRHSKLSWSTHNQMMLYFVFNAMFLLRNHQVVQDQMHLQGKVLTIGKKASDGMNSSLMRHVGTDPNSPHNIAMKCCEDLMNQSGHIDKIVEKETLQEIKNNRLRLKTSIDSVQWLAFQACPFRGHDESFGSKNQGNFIKLVKLLASYNDDVARFVLENAPKNAKYTSPKIQKEILHIITNKVRDAIRKEIRDAKFCILVDEARDESKMEQMATILRFVDKDSFIRERFFHIVHVKDTSAPTLKKKICVVLSRYNLQIINIRGQGYDGASNMRGELNGLQALFVKDCPYAYYAHYMTHKLQLALVAASREVKHIYQLFIQLASIINIVGGSYKRYDDLQSIHVVEIENLVASNVIETGRRVNQIGTLQRLEDTRWSSHYQSVCSMIRMFGATCSVINKISNDGANYSQRGDASGLHDIKII